MGVLFYVYDEYDIKLQYPVDIKTPNPKLAQVIVSQLGGADCKKR